MKKSRRFTVVYQLGYGLAGVLFNGYLFLLALNANQGLQVVLGICLFMAFSAGVFVAGMARHWHWKGSLLLSLLVQGVQVTSLHFAELHLRLRCGTAFDVTYELGLVKWQLDVTGVASELAWKMTPENYGINLFAGAVCALLLAESAQKKTWSPHPPAGAPLEQGTLKAAEQNQLGGLGQDDANRSL